MSAEATRILFVCLGNICRSPAAEAVMRACLSERGLDGRVEVDSAGTIDFHDGDPADPRMREAAAGRGYELDSRARRVTPEDFETFDLLIAMDRENLAELRAMAPNGSERKLRLLSEFLPDGSPRDVPDPYWGGPRGFDHVLDLLEQACPAILDEV